jgi:hypothetical protein
MGFIEQIMMLLSGFDQSKVEEVATQIQQSNVPEPVDSSAIDSVSYDKMKRAMTVDFTDQSEYIYLNVSQQEYDGMVNAVSIGKFFNSRIKGYKAFIRA